MKSKITILLALALAGVGCRSYVYERTDPSGFTHRVKVTTVFSDANISKLNFSGEGQSLDLEGYSQSTDAEAMKVLTEAVVSGAIQGAGKTVVPVP